MTIGVLLVAEGMGRKEGNLGCGGSEFFGLLGCAGPAKDSIHTFNDRVRYIL